MTGSHLLMLQAPLLKLDGGVHPKTRFIRLSGFTESAAFDATRWDSVCGLSARQRHNSARSAPMAYPRPACATRGNAAYGCSSSSTIDACIIYVLRYRQKVRRQTCRKPSSARTPPPTRCCPSLTGRGVCPPPARRDAAFAPLRLDGTRRLPPSGSTGRGVCPPPARLRAPPSRRLPLKGGVILERRVQASRTTPPLEGESQKPSRQAKADAEGGRRRPPAAAQVSDQVRPC